MRYQAKDAETIIGGHNRTETWALKKAQENELEVAEMRMLGWKSGVAMLVSNCLYYDNKGNNAGDSEGEGDVK